MTEQQTESTLKQNEQTEKEVTLELIKSSVDSLREIRIFKWVFVALTLVFIGITAFSSLYPASPKIVSFNVKDTTGTFLAQVAQLSLDENQKKNLVVRYQQNLDKVMKEYYEQGIIVLSTPAVLSPVEDKTSEIKAKISELMKAK